MWQNDLCERFSATDAKVKRLEVDVEDMRTKTGEKESRTVEMEDMCARIEGIRLDVAALDSNTKKTNEQVAEHYTALELLDNATRRIQKIAQDEQVQENANWAKLKTHETWLKTHDERHQGHLERGMRFEDQLEAQAHGLEKKFAQLEGQITMCKAEVAHSVQIKALMESKTTPDLLSATLLTKLDAVEKAHQQLQMCTATAIG